MKVDIFNTDKKYQIIYADPPWKYGGGKDKNFQGLAVDQYPTMKTKDICALPIDKIADDAVLFFVGNIPSTARGFQSRGGMGLSVQDGGVYLGKTQQKRITVLRFGFLDA